MNTFDGCQRFQCCLSSASLIFQWTHANMTKLHYNCPGAQFRLVCSSSRIQMVCKAAGKVRRFDKTGQCCRFNCKVGFNAFHVQLSYGMGLTLEEMPTTSNPKPFSCDAKLESTVLYLAIRYLSRSDSHLFRRCHQDWIKTVPLRVPLDANRKPFYFTVHYSLYTLVRDSLHFYSTWPATLSRFWSRSSNAALKKLQQQLASTLHT